MDNLTSLREVLYQQEHAIEFVIFFKQSVTGVSAQRIGPLFQIRQQFCFGIKKPKAVPPVFDPSSAQWHPGYWFSGQDFFILPAPENLFFQLATDCDGQANCWNKALAAAFFRGFGCGRSWRNI